MSKTIEAVRFDDIDFRKDTKFCKQNFCNVFVDCKFVNCIFPDIDIAVFTSCTFLKCDFSSDTLWRANFVNCQIEGCSFRDVDFALSVFLYCIILKCDFEGAKLSHLNQNIFFHCDEIELNFGKLVGIMNSIEHSKDLIGWKKCMINDINVPAGTTGIVKLLIPAAAKKVTPYGENKHRAEYAVVLEAPANAVSWYNSDFKYIEGHTIKPDSFDGNLWRTCTYGIHFFLTREEAVNYKL